MATAKQKTSPNKFPVVKILIITLLVLAVGYFAIIRPLQISREKQEFLNAEKEITAIADKIQDKIGQADQIEQDKYCSYASRKFERGPRSCTTYVKLMYQNVDPDLATQLSNQSFSIVDGRLYSRGGERLDMVEFVPQDQHRDQEFTKELDGFYGNFRCKLRINYPLLDLGAHPAPASENSMAIVALCSKSSIAEHFPVKE